MEVKMYCSNMRTEIVSWKAKIFDMMQKMDKRSQGSESQSSNSIKMLSEMVDEIEKKIARLESECPADWSKEKADVDHVISDMNRIWEESLQMSPDDF